MGSTRSGIGRVTMFCDRTVACLIEAIADAHTHTQLDTLILKLGLSRHAEAGGFSKQQRLHNLVSSIRSLGNTREGERLILSLAREFLETRVGDIDTPDPRHSSWSRTLEPLRESLAADGWLFEDGRLRPTTPSPAALAPEMSELERDLNALGFATALTHYRQAVDNFASGNYEAANGQLRSFLESLYIEVCSEKTGTTASDATGALQRLRQSHQLDVGEFNLTRGLLEVSNQRGAHQGLTHRQEAQFRLHFSTALGHYLVSRLLETA